MMTGVAWTDVAWKQQRAPSSQQQPDTATNATAAAVRDSRGRPAAEFVSCVNCSSSAPFGPGVACGFERGPRGAVRVPGPADGRVSHLETLSEAHRARHLGTWAKGAAGRHPDHLGGAGIAIPTADTESSSL
ncbi:hypothetical protein MTO96_019468 [Rhipicephalus appendiculatus]